MTNSLTSNQSDEALPLVERLNLACVASCDCMVKTPVVRYHKPLCKYRVMQEAAQVLSALTPVYETLMIGVAVRTPSTLLVNVQNAFRRSNCLSAIEREFFTREVEDDGSDEMIEDCPMNWGAEPAEYVKQFRDALAELRTAEPPSAIPDVLFDGTAVWQEAKKIRNPIDPMIVSDVLDAIVRLLRASATKDASHE